MDILTDIRVEYRPEEVLAHLHVAPESDDARDLAELVQRAAEAARPKAACAVRFIEEKDGDTVRVGAAGPEPARSVTLTSRVLSVNLAQVHRVFPYVATCGRELDELPGVAGDHLREWWLDELKVMALRAAAARAREHIEATWRPGKMSAMSPGSLQDWPITEQTQLFALLGDVEGAIGVRLTDSFLMVPTKSLSGLCFPTETTFESCSLCPREGCPGRRAAYEERLWAERYQER